jgi:hypothetical protein
MPPPSLLEKLALLPADEKPPLLQKPWLCLPAAIIPRTTEASSTVPASEIRTPADEPALLHVVTQILFFE